MIVIGGQSVLCVWPWNQIKNACPSRSEIKLVSEHWAGTHCQTDTKQMHLKLVQNVQNVMWRASKWNDLDKKNSLDLQGFHLCCSLQVSMHIYSVYIMAEKWWKHPSQKTAMIQQNVIMHKK